MSSGPSTSTASPEPFNIASMNDKKRAFVDLTDIPDSDSDDDIVITGFREVAKPEQQRAYAPSFDPSLRISKVPKVEINTNQTSLKTESSIIRELNQAVQEAPISARINGMEPVVFHGIEYNTELDLENRKKFLAERYNFLKQSITKDEQKGASIREQTITLNNRKERLRKLGTSSTDPTIIQIVHSLKRLSDESKNLHKRLQESKGQCEKARARYLNFENRDRRQISALLQARPNIHQNISPNVLVQEVAANPQIEASRYMIAQNSHLFQPLSNIQDARLRIVQISNKLALANLPHSFRSRLLTLRQTVEGYINQQQRALQHRIYGDFYDNDDDDDDDDDQDEEAIEGFHDGFGGRFGDYEIDFREQLRRTAQVTRSDVTRTNIYNMQGAEDNSSLKDLLVSVKKVEDAREGESTTPDDLTVNLLTHQRRGLHWLQLAEDDDKKRGGLLADDMGLGKTVQMIALMLSHRAEKGADMHTNLIVCPVALMNQWQAECEMKIKGSAEFSIFIYHGIKKRYSFNQLKKYDVVITSFTTLATEYKKHIADVVEDGERRLSHNMAALNKKKDKKSGTYQSPFFSSDAKFYRTILDEVQWIKNKATNMSLATAAIDSHYRWCLSGTPLQNKIDELFPYLRFLQIKPYNKEQRFRFDILIPLKSSSDSYDDFDKNKAMSKVRILLKAILLRREKNSVIDGKPILELPGKEVIYETLDISDDPNEASFYYSMEKDSRERVRELLNGPRAKGNYSSILTLLLRLRQAAIHSELVRIGERKQGIVYDEDGMVVKDPKKILLRMIDSASGLKENVVNRINKMEASDDGNRFTCPICIDSPPDENWTFFSPCGHGVCNECLDSFFEQKAEVDVANEKAVAKCSECLATVKKENVIAYDIFDRVCNKKQSRTVIEMVKEKELKEQMALVDQKSLHPTDVKMSPKFTKAIELIKQIFAENPNDKIILFSQFTAMFTLFKKVLLHSDIDPLLYQGSMNATTRNETVKEFYRNDNKKLMLISMKAGNVGLTLTCANHVIIMDPFWNPYVEEQAQDRAYRIGQFKPVKVYRILVKNSVEDRIMELQKKKKELIDSALDENGRNSVSSLNRQEIGRLFGINDL